MENNEKYGVISNAMGSFSIIKTLTKYDKQNSEVIATVYKKEDAEFICQAINKEN